MRYWRLLKRLARGAHSSYGVWRMDELERASKECYNCTTCGMAMPEPCEHWAKMLEIEGAGQ
jgi:Pyruvate/2-oxoacid:ferredoxin oxidoreductase delta subunit